MLQAGHLLYIARPESLAISETFGSMNLDWTLSLPY
jgi:hypothetical protein